MNDRISRWVARLLAHPAGFLAFNAFTAAWFLLPFAAGAAAWSIAGWQAALGTAFLVRWLLPGYLDVVTWFSSATQFTLANQNEMAAVALDQALDRIEHQTGLLVQFAESEQTIQQTLYDQTEAITGALEELAHHIAATAPKPRRRTP